MKVTLADDRVVSVTPGWLDHHERDDHGIDNRGPDQVIDATGCTVMPGLIESHGHLTFPSAVGHIDFRMLSGPLAVHVADTTDQAWDEAERGLHWWVEFYRRRGMQMPLAPVGELRHGPKAVIYGVPFAVGTPDQVIEKLRAYQDLPMDEMAIQFHHPGMDPEAVAASMRLFAAELLPEIQGWGTTG